MAKMNHPAIVNVFDFGETNTGLLFLPLAKGSDGDIQNTAFIVRHDSKGVHKAGFAHFHTQPAFSRNTPGWVNLEKPLGAKSRITVQVRQQQPDRLALKAWLDGKPLVAWEGPRRETTGGSSTWCPSKQGHFVIGTALEGTIFHRASLEAVEGEVTWLRETAKLAVASAGLGRASGELSL